MDRDLSLAGLNHLLFLTNISHIELPSYLSNLCYVAGVFRTRHLSTKLRRVLGMRRASRSGRYGSSRPAAQDCRSCPISANCQSTANPPFSGSHLASGRLRSPTKTVLNALSRRRKSKNRQCYLAERTISPAACVTVI